ncbi:PadR family transcriptional regulator [Brucella cytisi]|uniref:PadR family transcriptional regulator n=1 Tax=Brucella cytisi TaxID=407152 RepID=UPI0035DFFF0E
MLDYGELKLLLLAIIAERPSHGYELIKSVEDRFGGSYTPSPGVLYPTLSWLQDVGYTVFELGEGNRKIHRITPEGEAFLTVNRTAIESLLSRGGSNGKGGRRGPPAPVFQAMDSLKAVLRMRLRNSDIDEAGVARIAKIIEEATQRIEGEG